MQNEFIHQQITLGQGNIKLLRTSIESSTNCDIPGKMPCS